MAFRETKLVALLACAILLLVNGAVSQNQYVASNSVNCSATGIDFKLSEVDAESDLYKETHLDVKLFTGNPFAPVHDGDIDSKTGEVKLDYLSYSIVASIVYGANQRPLQYAIEQPFYAVPKSGHGRNYTFAVYCIIQAYANVNVSTNTSDQGHGDHGGDVVNPTDHVVALLQGLQHDGSTTLGDQLDFFLALKDSTYSGLIPVSCRYYNPNKPTDTMIIVADKCPIPFSNNEYFSPMKKIDVESYKLDFKAFAFETNATSFLAIECDVQLCISTNPLDCYKDCWGGPAPTGGTIAPTESPTETPTEAPTEASPVGPGRKRRSLAGLDNEKAPTSVTIKEKRFLTVNPKSNPDPISPDNNAISNRFTKNNFVFCLASSAALRFWFKY